MSAAIPSPTARRSAVGAQQGETLSPREVSAPAARRVSAQHPAESQANLLLADFFADQQIDDSPRLAIAGAGDHAAIHQFLIAVFQGLRSDAFFSTLDDPFYEPTDRVLIKQRHQILSHVHLTRRAIQFGELRIPITGVWSLATLPEYRSQGFGRALLKMVDQLMREDGSALGLLKTSIPHYFRSSGWAACGRHCTSSARTRDLLAQIATGRQRFDKPRPLTIRPWRQVELSAVMQLYRQHMARAYGFYERTENYWRWLISRQHFDQIFVALDGPDRLELDPARSPIVGYCVTRDDHIIELIAAPGRTDVGEALVARACSEAIEHDNHHMVLHAPADDPLQHLFRRSGGSFDHREVHQGEILMVKVLDPLNFLRQLCPELHRRADEARLTRPCELGLCIDEQRYRLTISRRSVKVSRQKARRSLSCNAAEFTRLVLGHLDLEEASPGGSKLRQVARTVGRVLFQVSFGDHRSTN